MSTLQIIISSFFSFLWFSFSRHPRYRPEQAAVFKDKDLKTLWTLPAQHQAADRSSPVNTLKLLVGRKNTCFPWRVEETKNRDKRRALLHLNLHKKTSVKSYDNYIIISWSFSAIQANICAKVEEIPLTAFKISHSQEQDGWTDIPVTWCLRPQESPAQRQNQKKMIR